MSPQPNGMYISSWIVTLLYSRGTILAGNIFCFQFYVRLCLLPWLSFFDLWWLSKKEICNFRQRVFSFSLLLFCSVPCCPALFSSRLVSILERCVPRIWMFAQHWKNGLSKGIEHFSEFVHQLTKPPKQASRDCARLDRHILWIPEWWPHQYSSRPADWPARPGQHFRTMVLRMASWWFTFQSFKPV